VTPRSYSESGDGDGDDDGDDDRHKVIGFCCSSSSSGIPLSLPLPCHPQPLLRRESRKTKTEKFHFLLGGEKREAKQFQLIRSIW